jgi:hypothetical protein
MDAFLAWMVTAVGEFNATAVAMTLNSTTDTSETSVAIGLGEKSFTVSTGKSFQPGMYIVIADTAAPSTNAMLGQITSYNTGTGALVVNSLLVTGSGTKTAWTISMSGPQAATQEYKNIFIPAAALIPTATNGAAPGSYEYATNDVNIDYLAFDGATEEFAGIHFPMPEDWDLGTIKAKFDWSSAAGSTAGDTAEWKIGGVAISNNDALDAAPGTLQVISDTLLANDGAKRQLSGATPAITIGGTPAAGDMIYLTVSRNVGGTDDMTEDAWLFGIWLQYHVSGTVTAW